MQKEIVYDICLHVGNGEEWLAKFYLEIKLYLEKKGLKVILFTVGKKIAAAWDKHNCTSYIKLPELEEKVDEKKCLQILNEAGFDSIGAFYRTEQYVFNLKEDYCVLQSCRHIEAVYKLKDAPRAKYYFTYEGDEFDHNSFRLLCRLHEGQMQYFGYSNLALRTHFHRNEQRYWMPEDASIQKPISKEEVKWIKDYVKSYTEARTTLWGNPKKFDIQFELNYFPRAAKKLWQQIRHKPLDKRFRFSNIISRYFMRLFRRQLAPLNYEKQLPSDVPFYYFPLHVPDDSQLTQRGLPFFNQVSLIETLSMYIPYPYKLVVKEHPNGRGLYKLRDLKKIASLPNVVLVPPQMNSHGIIPLAQAIFAINSSVGYEAIMYRKPVVAFGRSFYWKQGVTIDIESMYEMENINTMIKNFSLNEQDVMDFIWKVKKNTYDVNTYIFNSENCMSKVASFAEAIYNETFGQKA